MVNEPANHTIKLLNEMRAETREGFRELGDRLNQVEVGVAALSVDLNHAKEKLTDLVAWRSWKCV